MKKRTIIALSVSGLSFISLPLFLAHTTFAENLLKQSIQRQINDMTGETTEIADIQISLFKGQVLLDNFNLNSREGNDPILTIDMVRLHFNPFLEGPLLQHIQLESPKLSLDVDKNGMVQFRNRPLSTKETGSHHPWKSLSINNGEIRYNTPSFDIHLKNGEFKSSADMASMSFKEGEISTSQFNLPLEPFIVQDIAFTPKVFKTNIFTLESPGHLFHIQIDSNLKKQWEFLIDWYGSPKILLNSKSIYLDGNHHIEIDANDQSIDGTFVIHDAVVYRPNVKNYALSVGNPTGSWSMKGGILNISDGVTSFSDGTMWFESNMDFSNRDLNLKIMGQNLSLYQFSKELQLSKGPWVDAKFNIQSELNGKTKPFHLDGKSTIQMVDLQVASTDLKKRPPLLIHNLVKGKGRWNFQPSSMTFDFEDLKIDQNQLRFLTKIQLGEDKNFDISFDFDNIDLSSLKPLAGADLEGIGQLKGSIFGHPSQLQFYGDIKLNRFAIEDIPFADTIASNVSSKNLKQFQFNEFIGIKGSTTITGPMEINFQSPMTMNSNLMSSNARIEDLLSIFMDFKGLQGNATGSAIISGAVNNLDIATQFKLDNPKIWGESFENGMFQLYMADKLITINELSLKRPQGDSIYMRGSIQPDKRKQFQILGNNLHLGLFDSIKKYNLPLTGLGRFNVLLEGTPIKSRGLIQFSDIKYNDYEMHNARFSFNGASGKTTIKGDIPAIGVDILGHFTNNESLHYTMMANLNSFPLHMFYPITPNGTPIDSVIDGRMQFSDTPGDGPKIIGNVDNLSIQLSDMSIKSVRPWSFVHSKNDTRITDFLLVDDGKTSIKIDGRRAIDGNLDFLAQGQIDMSLLKAFVPKLTDSTGLARLNGTLQGPIDNPITELNLEIENSSLTASWFPHPFESLNGNIQITPNRYALNNLRGRVGGGDVVFNGYVASDTFIPDRVQIQSNFQNARLKTLDFLPTASAGGKLQLTGPTDQMLLKGDIGIEEMVFSERINWEDAILEFSGDVLSEAAKEVNTKPILAFHIGIKSDDTIRIRNNLADLSASASLQVVGDLSTPGLQGWIKGKNGGRVLIKERDFEVQRFDVRFTDAYAYNPELDIFMETRVESLDQDIDIQYLVSGRMRDWTAQTYSIPPLSQADINALLFFGMTRDEVERMGGLVSALAVEGSDLLASKFGVVQRFHTVSEGLFQGDFLEYLDRIDFISGSGSRGSGSFSSALRVIAEKDLGSDSTVRFEKNLTEAEDFYLSWEQKLADTFYAKGFWASEQQGRYLDIGGAYGLEFQVRWEVD